MTTCAIVTFPKFDGLDRIQHFRRQFDPLADIISPHITLVFPFESPLEANNLQAHVQKAVQGLRNFPITLHGITGSEGKYLFLNIKRGNDQLIDLHDRLYTGPLAAHRSLEHSFIPHVTVGLQTERAAFVGALQSAQQLTGVFQAAVKEVAVYQVDGATHIESTIWL